MYYCHGSRHPLLRRISLRVMTLTPSIDGVETKEGVAISCNGVAQVVALAEWFVASALYLWSVFHTVLWWDSSYVIRLSKIIAVHFDMTLMPGLFLTCAMKFETMRAVSRKTSPWLQLFSIACLNYWKFTIYFSGVFVHCWTRRMIFCYPLLNSFSMILIAEAWLKSRVNFLVNAFFPL